MRLCLRIFNLVFKLILLILLFILDYNLKTCVHKFADFIGLDDIICMCLDIMSIISYTVR